MSDRELYKEIDTAKKYNAYKELPDYIPENLNPRMELREYQKAAFRNFVTYYETESLRSGCLLYTSRQGLLDLTDNIPVHRGRVHLIPGSPMYGDGGSAAFLTGQGHLHRIALFPGIALAYLGRHGDRDRPGDCCHDGAASFRVAHQGASTPVPRDFWGRAAHIDVEDIRVIGHRFLSGAGHSIRIIAKQLYGGGVLLSIQAQ